MREYWRQRSHKYRQEHREKALGYTRIAAVKRRMRILTHYGGNPPTCACCGEWLIQILEIDHIAGGGAKHRESLGGGHKGPMYFYLWLIKNNFPSGYQVLCRNCNRAKGSDPECPHKLVAKPTGPIHREVEKPTPPSAKLLLRKAKALAAKKKPSGLYRNRGEMNPDDYV